MLTPEQEIERQGVISPELRQKNIEEIKKYNLELPFDLESVDSKCHECVLRQLDKYNKFVDEFGKSYKGKFVVPCEGVNVDYFDQNMKSGFTDEQWDEIRAQLDIVHWAHKYLKQPTKEPWNARWYQEHILRCSSRRKILRISRRSGKCISADSSLLTEKGPLLVKDIFNSGNHLKLATFSEDNSIDLTSEYSILSNGEKEVFEIKTSDGRVNSVTDNHPYLKMGFNGILEWVELKDLNVNEKILCPASYKGLIKGESIGVDKAKLLGYLTGDGGTNYADAVRFTNFDSIVVDDFARIIDLFDCELTILQEGNYIVVSKNKDKHVKYKNEVNRIVTEANLRKLAKEKVVPKQIMSATENEIASYLAAYWDCDGWCSISKKSVNAKGTKTVEIGCCSASKQLMLDIKHLLLRLGIPSSISYKKVKYKDSYKDAWQLYIKSSDGVRKFYKNVPLLGKKDNIEKVMAEIEKKEYHSIDSVPSNILNYIKAKYSKKEIAKVYKGIRPSYKCDISKDKLFKIGTAFNDEYLLSLCDENTRWEKIHSIKSIGIKETFDVSVPSTNTLISDDIISHNTDMVCIDICYHLFTTPNIRIVVAGPQKAQTEEIINRVRAFIRASDELAACVVRDVSAPYYNIKLTNGAELRGFAAGGTKGGDGSSIRGQDCDRLYLEEMDFIAEEAISSAVLPLLQTKAGTTLVGFSTPSGMRTPYYSFCMETPEAKEFHYSYKVLPHWKAVEADRTRYTEERWTHEFLAEFGSSDSGVYKPQYVDSSIENYRYSDFSPTQGWKYCIGTDWNEKYGTEIYVLGFNPFRGRFYGVEALHIEPSQFTQLEGVNKLLEMNRKWRPEFIYIDAGNGSTNEELLMSRAIKARRSGVDEPTANLVKSLKKYDLGSAIETKDQLTKQPVKKPAKAFMVNASVRLFEQDRIRIPSEDIKLDKQLRNYIIERYTPNGNPVYGQNDEKIGDHRLDALNLAVVAFHLEFDELHATNSFCTDVGAAPDPRIVKMQLEREQKGEEIHTPQERRLEGDGRQNELEMLFFPSAPGRLSKSLDLKTNRLGWDTDQEGIRLLEAQQRRRGRINRNRQRPVREKF
jgi:intein/homing endonuclease